MCWTFYKNFPHFHSDKSSLAALQGRRDLHFTPGETGTEQVTFYLLKLNWTCMCNVLRNVKLWRLQEHNSYVLVYPITLSMFLESGVCPRSSGCSHFLWDGISMGRDGAYKVHWLGWMKQMKVPCTSLPGQNLGLLCYPHLIIYRRKVCHRFWAPVQGNLWICSLVISTPGAPSPIKQIPIDLRTT